MKSEARKSAIADYKKRESVAGIYAVRCQATSEIWVGQALNLEKIQNRIFFSLRMGDHANRDLQRVWTDHGPSLVFEELERLKADELPYVRDRLLKERSAHWCAQLGAKVL